MNELLENKQVLRSLLKDYISFELLDLVEDSHEKDTYYKSIDIEYSNKQFHYDARFYIRYFKNKVLSKLVLANISANKEKLGVISIFEEIAKDFGIDFIEIECLSNYQIYLALIKKNWILLSNEVLSDNQVSAFLSSQLPTDKFLNVSVNLQKALK